MAHEWSGTQTESTRWASNKLGLDPSSSSIEMTAILRLITRSEYELPAEQIEAARMILSPSKAADWASRCQWEYRLTEQVEQFAKTFFADDPRERKKRWQSLHQECKDCASPRLWLEELRSGLDWPVPLVSKNELVNQFTKNILGTFVLRLPDRSRSQVELIAELQANMQKWEEAILELRSQQPDWVRAIDPWMLTLLGQQSETGLTSAAFPDSSPRPVGISGDRRSQPKPIASTVDTPEQSGLSTLTWPFLVIVLLVLKGLLSLSPPPAPSRVAIPSGPRELQFSYFSLLKDGSPDIYHGLCREIPDLETALSNPYVRRQLENYVAARLPEIYSQIRNRYQKEGTTTSLVKPTWVEDLAAISKVYDKVSPDTGFERHPASALSPENRVLP